MFYSTCMKIKLLMIIQTKTYIQTSMSGLFSLKPKAENHLHVYRVLWDITSDRSIKLNLHDTRVKIGHRTTCLTLFEYFKILKPVYITLSSL